MEKKILLLTGLMLAIGAAVYVSWPTEVKAVYPGFCDPEVCGTPCECPTYTINNGLSSPCDEFEFVFEAPVAIKSLQFLETAPLICHHVQVPTVVKNAHWALLLVEPL